MGYGLLAEDGGYAGEGFALDGLEHGTTTGRDIGYLVGKAELVNGCYRVATAHEGVSTILSSLSYILSDFASTVSKVFKLKYADGTVPQDGLAVEDDLLPVGQSGFAGIHTLPTIGDIVDVNRLTVSVVGETVSGNRSYREAQVHAFLLGSGNDVEGLGHQVVLVQ